MFETCRSIFKSFNVKNLSVCIGWCADQVEAFVFALTAAGFLPFGHLYLDVMVTTESNPTFYIPARQKN